MQLGGFPRVRTAKRTQDTRLRPDFLEGFFLKLPTPS